jgi:cysteinyl-tRNA synthetase
VELVSRLRDKGLTYERDGSTYFRINKFDKYGHLSGVQVDEESSFGQVDEDEYSKENPRDFVLWKGHKDEEDFWDSPFGEGRPGWHLECSAMSMKYLGETFDIHCGGVDLVFPHHENEIAQSEGASGKPFVKYWLHNGFVNVNQEKMSKSLGNFFTIRDILKIYDPEVVRFFILTAHYRSPIDFSDQNLVEAQSGTSRFYEALETAAAAVKDIVEADMTSAEGALLETRFREAMDDDFNTALAIAHLFDGVRTMNRLVATQKFAKKAELVVQVRALHATILRLGEVLGLFRSEPTAWLEKVRFAGLTKLNITQEKIEGLIEQRLQARKEKDFTRSDEIRDELDARGILLLDTRAGTTWKLK